MPTLPTATQEDLAGRAREIARAVIAPRAEEVDRDAAFPGEQLRALGAAGLLGLEVPPRLGGHGAGLTGLARVTEEIARECASTALCFAMHCVATAVIAAKPTREQERRLLAPIAEGRHLASVALAEPGTGAEFYLPRATMSRDGDFFILNGCKDFVTSGGEADSYVISVVGNGRGPPGVSSCLVVDRDPIAGAFGPREPGIGMRGSSSRSLTLSGVRVGIGSLLGDEGDHVSYAFEVVTPRFLVATAGLSVGIAGAALDHVIEHLGARRHAHQAEPLARNPWVQQPLARCWTAVARARALVREAALGADRGDAQSDTLLMAAKLEAVETAVAVANEGLTLCGGLGYREGRLGRLLRDARAGHVLSPTTTMLLGWVGRSVLGLPPL